MRIESVVNDVRIVFSGSNVVVRKKYHPRSLGLGVEIPVERAMVEERVLRKLGTMRNDYVFVPEIRAVASDCLDIEYVCGKTLSDELHGGRGVDQSTLYELGAWLKRVEVDMFYIHEDVFLGLESVEQECRRVMGALKTPGVSLQRSEDTGFSLGDVGLRNILWTGDGYCLLDFEFAHLSKAGRDVAQLVSQFRRAGDVRASELVINQAIKYKC